MVEIFRMKCIKSFMMYHIVVLYAVFQLNMIKLLMKRKAFLVSVTSHINCSVVFAGRELQLQKLK